MAKRKEGSASAKVAVWPWCQALSRPWYGALQGVFARWQVEVPLPTALQLWKQIEPNAQVMQHVATLRSAGVRVCVASNQQSHRAGIMADHLGYRSQFDALFFSCELGFVKPDVRYFEAMLNTLEVAPESVLFVDDHQQNVDAAKTTGMGAALYELNQGIGPFRAMLETHQLPT